jgi:DUF971 family protein
MERTPTTIEQFSPTEMRLRWNSGEEYALPYLELRYQCPCAGCVDEHSGKRTVQRASIAADVRPVSVQLIGRYALQITWSDRHDTGMYHYDRLFELCQQSGRKVS